MIFQKRQLQEIRPCVLPNRPPMHLWLSPGEMWDAISPITRCDRVNCRKGANTETQGAGVKNMGYEVYVG